MNPFLIGLFVIISLIILALLCAMCYLSYEIATNKVVTGTITASDCEKEVYCNRTVSFIVNGVTYTTVGKSQKKLGANVDISYKKKNPSVAKIEPDNGFLLFIDIVVLLFFVSAWIFVFKMST
jgi:hypothetical protein